VHAPRVAVCQRPHDGALALHIAGVEIAHQGEVEQAQPAVRAEDAVLRLRIAGDDAVTPSETEKKRNAISPARSRSASPSRPMSSPRTPRRTRSRPRGGR
jgi:hypothetical protein